LRNTPALLAAQHTSIAGWATYQYYWLHNTPVLLLAQHTSIAGQCRSQPKNFGGAKCMILDE